MKIVMVQSPVRTVEWVVPQTWSRLACAAKLTLKFAMYLFPIVRMTVQLCLIYVLDLRSANYRCKISLIRSQTGLIEGYELRKSADLVIWAVVPHLVFLNLCNCPHVCKISDWHGLIQGTGGVHQSSSYQSNRSSFALYEPDSCPLKVENWHKRLSYEHGCFPGICAFGCERG